MDARTTGNWGRFILRRGEREQLDALRALPEPERRATPVGVLQVSLNVRGLVAALGARTLGDLADLDLATLRAVEGFGAVTRRELLERLVLAGLWPDRPAPRQEKPAPKFRGVRVTGDGLRWFATGTRGHWVRAGALSSALQVDPSARRPTADDWAALLKAVAYGRRPELDVAAGLGVTPAALRSWRKRAGVKGRAHHVQLAQQRALRAVKRGATFAEAAAAEGLNRSALGRVGRAMGLASARARKPPLDEPELVRQAAGRTWPELAAIVDRSMSGLRNFVYSRPTLARALRAVMVRRMPRRKGT